ncbi:MAG: hypothetical protein JW709_06515 [Sedimentisphaerales bacterium]|nr:hypothetical protein [Sedimentisphaerales bacterium]
MTYEITRDALMWSLVLNVAFIMIWFAMFSLARDWIYRMHSKWFKISEERFDAIHYTGMAFYKIFIVVFNAVPLLALIIVY